MHFPTAGLMDEDRRYAGIVAWRFSTGWHACAAAGPTAFGSTAPPGSAIPVAVAAGSPTPSRARL